MGSHVDESQRLRSGARAGNPLVTLLHPLTASAWANRGSSTSSWTSDRSSAATPTSSTSAASPSSTCSKANHFDAVGHDGPFRVRLRVEENRLAIDLHDEAGEALATIRMGLARFRRPIRDYFAICESYFKTVRSEHPRGIEAIDMARRGLHNEAAELLQECLQGKVDDGFRHRAAAVHPDLRAPHQAIASTVGAHPPEARSRAG